MNEFSGSAIADVVNGNTGTVPASGKLIGSLYNDFIAPRTGQSDGRQVQIITQIGGAIALQVHELTNVLYDVREHVAGFRLVANPTPSPSPGTAVQEHPAMSQANDAIKSGAVSGVVGKLIGFLFGG